MGWFHLFSKIKVVSNNFLSEQTVGRLILLGMVVNRGFFCSTQVVLPGCCCLGVSRTAGTSPGSASALTETKAVLPGLGWTRRSSEGTLRTEHQASAEEILKQNWSSFSPKPLINCICRAKPTWSVSTGTTSEMSNFGVGISHLGCQRKCLPGPLQPVFHCCCRDGRPYHDGIALLLTETHPTLTCIKQFRRTPWFWVKTWDHPIHFN